MTLDRDFPDASLVTFAGRCWKSRFIAIQTCSLHQLFVEQRWASHVGILFHHNGIPMVAESTTWDEYPCEITGRRIRGVQAHSLASRAGRYDGSVWVLPITKRRQLSGRRIQKLNEIVIDSCGTPYDVDGAIYAGTRFLKRLSFHYQDLRNVFCSEFARSIYSDLHLLAPDNASNATPGSLDREVRWVGLCEQPIRIKS